MYMFLDFGVTETATGQIGVYFSRTMLRLPLGMCSKIATEPMRLSFLRNCVNIATGRV